MTSLIPPAPYGVTTFTVWSGHCCANDGRTGNHGAQQALAIKSLRLEIIIVSLAFTGLRAAWEHTPKDQPESARRGPAATALRRARAAVARAPWPRPKFRASRVGRRGRDGIAGYAPYCEATFRRNGRSLQLGG